MRCSLLILLLLFSASRVNAQDSLDIKIGQMILTGFPKAEVDPVLLESVRQGKVGSIIIFEKNIPAKNSFLGLKKITWTYQHAAPVPLFIAIDQEGGRVNRLKEKYGFPRSVSAAKLGKSSLDSVKFYSQITAATLAGLGVNVNFAPVVDLASNPDNPIIADLERAFSKNADSVALFATTFIREHHQLGVLTALKHFPGHGSSLSDTHLDMTDVTDTWSEKELTPYAKLLRDGMVDAVMTAHIVNGRLDQNKLPATLSPAIIDSLLRRGLQFNGVVFSDDMQMHAISKHYSFEESVKLAILAGVDILCFTNNIQGSQERTVDKVHGIIRNFVTTGVIPADRIEQSYRRIMTLKQRLGTTQAAYYRMKWAEAESEAVRMKQLADERALALESEKQAQEAFTEKQSGNSKKKKKK
ncbi:glycoside hydrolase family 3 N-terminal domain-containing protein [Oscillatoria amoena NRMC-F 0135]|nr:glycoside hydrolase family 3 N-terminal domain-containing protein [Oscillatoria amoena NRMC-F 0135]